MPPVDWTKHAPGKKARPHDRSGDHPEDQKREQDRCWAVVFARSWFEDGFRQRLLGSEADKDAALAECGLEGNPPDHGKIKIFASKDALEIEKAKDGPQTSHLYRYLPDFLPGPAGAEFTFINYYAIRAFRQQYGMNTGAF